MAARYNAYLLRRWRIDGEQRVEILHIASGNAARFNSLPEAARWIQSQSDTGDEPTERAPEASRSTCCTPA